MKTTINYYRVLGIEPGATEKEVKTAYRKLALVHHPDASTNQNPNTKGTTAFQGIQEAYDVLASQTRRATYDQENFPQFGRSQSSTEASGSTYQRLTADDINRAFADISSDRISVAQYNARRSATATRRVGTLNERKIRRAAKLPSTASGLWFLALPVAAIGIWSVNIYNSRQTPKKN